MTPGEALSKLGYNMNKSLKKELFDVATAFFLDKGKEYSYIMLEEYLETYMDEKHPDVYVDSSELMDICDDVYRGKSK